MTPVQRRMIVPVVSLVLAVLLLAVTAWVTLRDAGSSRPGGLGAVGGPFELTSQEGAPISEKDLRGRPFLIFFGFTNCPDVCPTALREISDVFEALGPDRKVAALFVTVDPERDTPELLKGYAPLFHPRIRALTGTPEELAAVFKTFGVTARKVPGAGSHYLMDHSSSSTGLDRQGRVAASIGSTDTIARSVTTLRDILGKP